MQITAITRFKNGALLSALRQAGLTGTDLARLIGKTTAYVSSLMTLRTKPTEEVANQIQEALAKHGVAIDVLEAWPAEFKPFRSGITVEQTQDVDPKILEYAERKQLEAEGRNVVDEELVAKLEVAVLDLPPILRSTVKMRFFDDLSLEQIARRTGVSRGGVSERLSRAFETIRTSPAFRNTTGFEPRPCDPDDYKCYNHSPRKEVDLAVELLTEQREQACVRA